MSPDQLADVDGIVEPEKLGQMQVVNLGLLLDGGEADVEVGSMPCGLRGCSECGRLAAVSVIRSH